MTMQANLKALDSIEGKDNTNNINMTLTQLKWHDVDMSIMEYNGMNLYPEGTRIQILPANVELVRVFTSIDEDNVNDVNEAMNFAIENNVRIKTKSGKILNGSNTFYHDRFKLILLLRTYSNIETKLQYETTCCKHKLNVSIEPHTLVFKEIDKHFKEVFNSKKGVFKIETIRFGVLEYVIPTNEYWKRVETWVIENRDEEIPKGFYILLPLLYCGGDVQKSYDKFLDLSKDYLAGYTFAANNINIGGTQFVTAKCPKCGVKQFPIKFESKIQNLFSNDVQFGDFFA